MSDEKSATLSAVSGNSEQALVVATPEDGGHREKSGLWPALLRLFVSQHMLALIDQAIVSGASFLTTVFVGRWANSTELGIYAIGSSLLVSALMIQESLIVLPYTIHRHERDGMEAARSGSALTHNGALSALGLVLLAAVALGSNLFGVSSQFEPMVWALAGIAPFVLTREICRRFAIAELNIMRALKLDAAVAAIQLLGLGWLAETDRISAATALIAIGIASGAPAVVWLFIHRREFAFGANSVRADLKKNWLLGKWLFAGQLIVQIESYVAYWLSLAIVGAAATGVVAAGSSIIAVANPFISAFRNILMPRLVRAWRKGGSKTVRTQALRDSLLLGVGTGAFCVILCFYGGDLLQLLYHGEEYRDQGVLIGLLAVAMFASTMGLPASTALAAMKRPGPIVWAGAAGAVVTTALVWSLTVKWGLVGTGLGLVLGSLVGAAGRWLAFFVVVSRLDSIDKVLADVGTSAPLDCAFDIQDAERLDEGTQAVVYAVRSKSAAPMGGEGARLIVKIFKANSAASLETVQAQASKMIQNHATMNGKVVDGWRIVIPESLHVCASPLAIVMTEAPGRSLYNWTKAGDGLTPDLLSEIAAAAVGAMGALWTRGEIHGDFALQNMLCDASNKTLAFIDFGAKGSCPPCDGEGVNWPPAVSDLAHLVIDVGADVRRSIGNRNARRLRRSFASSALSTYLLSIGSLKERQSALGAISDCARAHVDVLFDLSWSPQGLWRRYVKFVTVRRMTALLAAAKALIDECENRLLRDGGATREIPAPPEMGL